MSTKSFSQNLILMLLLVGGIVVSGCSSNQSQENNTEMSASETDFYTCGMHPNVIQEGPGNCPICGMKLMPLNGSSDQGSSTSSQISESGGEKKILYYRAPMDPTYISPKPGKSPMGMDLIPVYEGEETFGSTVKINPVTEQNIGVRTALVEQRDLFQSLRTIGRIDYDETRVSHVHTKFTGWIEKTHVNTTGQKVNKGDILLEIYSPKLVTAQEEYLDTYLKLDQAKKENRTAASSNLSSILASTRKRLEYFDISLDQIDALEQTGEVHKTLAIRSPFNGIVYKKHALDGMDVKPGMELYTIADLSEVWVYADLFEYEVPWVQAGQSAIMTLSYAPGKKFEGEVQYIYPYLEEKTRTVKVRLTFDNPDLVLKPGMYTNVKIKSAPVRNAIAVPAEAVMFSGERNLVFVALGEGRFAPRDVTIGVESGDDFYEIIDGINVGEKVVTSAQFLLDSESKLQESIAKMLATRKGIQSGVNEESNQASIKNSDLENRKEPGMDDMNMEHDHDNHNQSSDTPDHKMKSMDMMEEQQEHGEHTDMKMGDKISFAKVENDSLLYYTCPMESHSYVKMSEPGSCPDCGMTLMEKKEIYDPERIYYTCPMSEHAYVVTEEPGNCPVCGMTLVEKN
jgi:Cu(I)/Ag(I) efflux system membrane fusion protein/cobalt-zinc-cadmium efflux system membrane fusion protein